MSNQLQNRLDTLRDHRATMGANQARLHDLTSGRVSVGEHIAWDTLEERQGTESSTNAVEREIAALEKTLQQWLAARSTDPTT